MTSTAPNIGQQIKTLRQARGLSLARLAEQTPMSEATLSRIENGLSDITASNLYALAAAMDVKIEQFIAGHFSANPKGLRSVTRSGQGAPFRSGVFQSHLLSADLSSKQMNPFINVTSARSVEEAGGLNAHPGEEFLLVIDGRLCLHTEHYEPLNLDVGDSVYFDGTMPHTYTSNSSGPAKFLVVTSEAAAARENHP
ncbi:MAG: helix-turn-helix domain-containing protein [Rhizobiaceae bacterium]